jgi:23S rRNA G2445 N2-methylase RlmL
MAMMRDLGSRDKEFIATIKLIRTELLKVAQVDPQEWTTVPMQGSGTFAVEAVLQTAIPRKNGRVRQLILKILKLSFLKWYSDNFPTLAGSKCNFFQFS